MFTYSVYGINLHAEMELPELAGGEGTADATVRFGKVDRLPAEAASQWQSWHATPTETCLFFQGIGAFLVRNGTDIVADPAENAEPGVIRLAILGPALSMLLHQRGLLVLHASGVAVRERVIGFLGGSGWGKSTMAAALHTRGYPLVADDLVVIDFERGEVPLVMPGFPQLKLWPEAITSLGDSPEQLERLHPLMDKRARRAIDGFSPEPLPLHCLYVLEDSDALGIDPLPRQQAFIELVGHSHDALLLEETGASSEHFRQCTRLVNATPIYRLNRPRDLARLPDVVALIEQSLT
ncbi:MAG: serine kinase [Chloroflexi bacterium]|nr:serine kinase [Chloroflexota bacterium]